MRAALSSQPLPYSLPDPAAPVRVAFAGPATTFAAHALHTATAGVEPHFLDVRPGVRPNTVRGMLEASAPHVVVAFAPEVVAPGALDGVRAVVLAVTSAPFEPGVADRVLRTPGAAAGDAWRVGPLPVDDRLYASVRRMTSPPRALYLGRSTAHRERLLTPAKHAHDVVHYAHGLIGEALSAVLNAADIGIALHRDAEPGFPPQALLHLAAGHLLLSEPLAPACGLEPGVDFLEIASGAELVTVLDELRRSPGSHDRVRVHGRHKAEEHRASRVWPTLVHELLQDVEAFGTTRTLHA